MATLAEIVWAQQPDYVRSADDGTGFALLQAVCAQADQIVALLDDPATWMDPTATPASQLPWVAALAGIDLTSVPDAAKRAFVASETSRYRGSESAIRQRVGLTLTGSKSVVIVCPYGGDPDAIAVTTFAVETPDEAATEAAIRAEIPAWMAADIVTDAAGQSYAGMASDYTTYGAMSATGKTYGTLAQEI